jgi:hypothetical protein
VGGWLGVKAIHPPLGAAQRVRSSFARCTLRFRRVPGSAHSLALKLTFSLFCPRPCSAAYTYTSIADCHTRSANALATREQLRNLAKQRIGVCRRRRPLNDSVHVYGVVKDFTRPRPPVRPLAVACTTEGWVWPRSRGDSVRDRSYMGAAQGSE